MNVWLLSSKFEEIFERLMLNEYVVEILKHYMVQFVYKPFMGDGGKTTHCLHIVKKRNR